MSSSSLIRSSIIRTGKCGKEDIFKLNFSNQIELLCSSLSMVVAREGKEHDPWRWCLYPRSRGSEFKLWSEILWSFLLIVNVTSRPPDPLLRDQSWFPAPSVTIWTERDNWGIKELVMLPKMRARKLASLRMEVQNGGNSFWQTAPACRQLLLLLLLVVYDLCQPRATLHAPPQTHLGFLALRMCNTKKSN